MAQDPSPPNSVDLAHLYSAELVEKLKAQVVSSPEVRWDRVEALKRAMGEGSYEISPERIAEAMLADARKSKVD
jgi:flagellar biosynthesis anti-sigma factor FlgM